MRMLCVKKLGDSTPDVNWLFEQLYGEETGLLMVSDAGNSRQRIFPSHRSISKCTGKPHEPNRRYHHLCSHSTGVECYGPGGIYSDPYRIM